MNDSDRALAKLLAKVSPAMITLQRPRFAALDGAEDVELSVKTRDATTTFVGSSVSEAATEALELFSLDEEDPYIPAWKRLSRMQRELVLQTIHEACARHMAKAAEAKIGHDDVRASIEFEIADAFSAAASELDYPDVDREGVLMPKTEKLEGVTVPFTPRRKRSTPVG